jgi:hypothetical protein
VDATGGALRADDFLIGADNPPCGASGREGVSQRPPSRALSEPTRRSSQSVAGD